MPPPKSAGSHASPPRGSKPMKPPPKSRRKKVGVNDGEKGGEVLVTQKDRTVAAQVVETLMWTKHKNSDSSAMDATLIKPTATIADLQSSTAYKTSAATTRTKGRKVADTSVADAGGNQNNGKTKSDKSHGDKNKVKPPLKESLGPSKIVFSRPDFDDLPYLEDRRPAGVFCLQHKGSLQVWWGTAWDLYEAKKEHLGMIRQGIHPCKAFQGVVEKEVLFRVVKEVHVPLNFQLSEFEAQLQAALVVERDRYRRQYTERLVQLYKIVRIRAACRLWYQKARSGWLQEMTGVAIEIQRWIRSFLTRARLRRRLERERIRQSQHRAALWCQKHFRGYKDRGAVTQALEVATREKKTRLISSTLDPSPFPEGIKYKIRRLEYLDRVKPKPFHRACCDHDHHHLGLLAPCGSMALTSPKQTYHPFPKKEFIGYDSSITRLNARKSRYDAPATIIQKWWRGYAARLYVKKVFKSLRHRRLQRDRAAKEIQLWYRGQIMMRKAMDDLFDYKWLKRCATRVQSWYRGCRARKAFNQQYGELLIKRKEGAVVVQRLARGYKGRKIARRMRNKLLQFRMAGRIMGFFVKNQPKLVVIRQRILQRKTVAVIIIQAYTRRYLAERRLHRLGMERRRIRAANRIKLAWRRHKARRVAYVRSLILAFGACQFCYKSKAAVYLEDLEQRLCRVCYHRTMEILHSNGKSLQGRMYEMAEYRRMMGAALSIQLRYRYFLRWKKAKFGLCQYCPRPVRLYCWSCHEMTCHTCADIVHEVKILRKHKRMGIELYRKQKKAAAIICRFFVQKREKIKLYRKFGKDKQSRKHFGCTNLQRLWRGHYCRSVYRLYYVMAMSMISRIQHKTRVYAAWSSYLLLMKRLPAFIDDDSWKPELAGFQVTFGYGLITRITRKIAALVIEKMLIHRLEFKRAKAITDRKRLKKAGWQKALVIQREAMVRERMQNAITIQRVFRGYSKRLIFCAASQARRMTHRVVCLILDTAALWKKAQATWNIHRGFLGKLSIHSMDLANALAKGGIMKFQLLPDCYRDRDATQMLVGGQVTLSMSVERYPGPVCTVTEPRCGKARNIQELVNEMLDITFCTHRSAIKVAIGKGRQPSSSILKIQLVGVLEVLAKRPILSSTERFACDIYVWGTKISSSTRCIRPKVEPCYYDEVLYVSLLGPKPQPGVPFLRIEAYYHHEDSSRREPVGRLCLGILEALAMLGKKIFRPLESPLNRAYYLAALLTMESPARTQSREIVQALMQDLLAGVRRELDHRTPRVELRVMETRILPWVHFVDQGVYKVMRCEVWWNGDLIETTPAVPAKYVVPWDHLYTLQHMDGYPQDQVEAVIKLKADTEMTKNVTVASAALSYQDLYVPDGRRRRVDLIALVEPSSSTDPDQEEGTGVTESQGQQEEKRQALVPTTCCIGTVEIDITSRYVRKPPWKHRRDCVGGIVSKWVRSGIDRVPQPRVEFQMHEVVQMPVAASDVEVHVFWGGKLKARLKEIRRIVSSNGLGDENVSIKETICFDRQEKLLLFFADGQDWHRMPEFHLEFWGTLSKQPALLAEVYLANDEILLQPKARPAQMVLTRRLEGDYKGVYGVYRKLQGVASCLITAVDIPSHVPSTLRLPYPRLCVSFRDLRYDVSTDFSLSVMTGLVCHLFWKGVEVAKTDPARSAISPKWSNKEVYVMPIANEAEHPGVSTTIPLLIQVYRTGKDGQSELLGEVVPFDGTLKPPVPITYYPFEVLGMKGSKHEGQLIAQLGLAVQVDHIDVDKEASYALLEAVVEEPKLPSMKDFHEMAQDIHHERSRKYSLISALQKTEQEAHDLLVKAQEVAKAQPKDKPLQQYVKLLEAEYERAKKATKAAKLKDHTVSPVKDVNPAATKTPTKPKKKNRLDVAHRAAAAAMLASPDSSTISKQPSTPATSSMKTDAPKSLPPPRSPASTVSSVSKEDSVVSVASAPAPAPAAQVPTDQSTPIGLDSARALLNNHRLSPPYPVLQPSVFLKMDGVKGLSTGVIFKSNPKIHVYWCRHKVGETKEAKPEDGRPDSYLWDQEEVSGFLLPMPIAKDMADLRVEVWAGNDFGGEVIIEGCNLAQEYADLQAPNGRYATSYQLMPKDYSNKVNNFGKLSFYIVPLQPTQYKPIFDEVKQHLLEEMRTALGDNAPELMDNAAPGSVTLTSSQLRYISRSYLWREITYKLHVLSASNLPKVSMLDITDPLIVVKFRDQEIGRTKGIDNTLDPIFNDGVFEVPFECVVDEEDIREIVIEVYDSNVLANDILMAHATLKVADLQALQNQVKDFPLVLEPPKSVISVKGKDQGEPVASTQAAYITCGGCIMRKPPGVSRLELRALTLTDLVEMPSLLSKAVTLTFFWNRQQIAQLEGQLSKNGALKLEKEHVDLPFECHDLEGVRFSEFPTALRIDFHGGSSKNGDKLKFLGQVEACGPFGLVLNVEELSSIGVEQKTATYRLTPRPYMLDSLDAADVRTVGGRVTLQLLLCEPTELAFSWYEALPGLEREATKTEIRVMDALDLAHLEGGAACSAVAIVYFNNREIGRTTMISATDFPCWGKPSPFLVPLAGHSQSRFVDEVVIELHHGGSTPTRLLGEVVLPATHLYQPPLRKVDYVLKKKSYGSTKAQELVQGSVSLLMDLRNTSEGESKPLIDTGALLKATSDGGMRPMKWIRLHISKARGLRGPDGATKADTYCFILWKRQVTHKTVVVRRPLKKDHNYNQTFRLYYEPEDTKFTELELRILVIAKPPSGPEVFLGQLVFTGDQLMNVDDQLREHTLQPRDDVASDLTNIERGSLFLALYPEVEKPYRDVISSMGLMIADRYLALEVVQVDKEISALLEQPGSPAATTVEAAPPPSIFVTLTHDGREIARTACIPLFRGEARFVEELFILPVGCGGRLDLLQQFDLALPITLDVFGVFPTPTSGQILGPSLRHLGFLELTPKELTDCPTFQARYPLTVREELGEVNSISSSGPTAGDSKRMSVVLAGRRASTSNSGGPALPISPGSVSLRTAFVNITRPRTIEVSKEFPMKFLRVRLRVLGLTLTDTEGGKEISKAGRFYLDIVFCGTARAHIEIPLIEQTSGQEKDVKVESSSVFNRELILSDFQERSFNDANLVMVVTREMMVAGQLVTETIGQSHITWGPLSQTPFRMYEYGIAQLQMLNLDDKANVPLASRLVYAQTCESVSRTDGSSSATINRVSPFQLLYGLGLELPCPSKQARQLSAQNLKVFRTRVVSSAGAGNAAKALRHVTDQGFPCPDALHDSRQMCRRVRLVLRGLYRKILAPGNLRPWLRRIGGTCVITWNNEEVAVASLSKNDPLTDAERTFHLPLDPSFPDHDCSLSLAFSSDGLDGCLTGRLTLDGHNFLRLPRSRSGYHVTCGDEISYDMCNYLQLKSESLASDHDTSVSAIVKKGSHPTIFLLGTLIADVSVCIEESPESTPYMMTINVERADGLRDCSQWGYARIPGMKKRHVYALTSHDSGTWHATKAAWSNTAMEVDFIGPRCALPVQDILRSDLNIGMKVYDFGTYEGDEASKVLRVQCLVRSWLARKKKQMLANERASKRKSFTAAAFITQAVCKWLKLRQRNQAATIVTRIMRGYTERLRMERMIQISKASLTITDIKYIPFLENANEAGVPLSCVVYWNGREIHSQDMTAKTTEPCPINMTFNVPLKKVIRGQGQLHYVVDGLEYFLVDRSELTVVVTRRTMQNNVVGPDTHVARLRLHKGGLRHYCKTITREGYKAKPYYHRLHLEPIPAELASSHRHSLVSAFLSGTPDALSSFVMVGLLIESIRPLWTTGIDRSIWFDMEDQVTHHLHTTSAALARTILEDVINDAMDLVHAKPLEIRLVYAHDLPRPVLPAVSLNPVCTVIWEGSMLGSIRFASSNDGWCPKSSSPDDNLFKLTPPTSEDAELLVLLHHDGMFGRTSLGSASLSVDELCDMRRRVNPKSWRLEGDLMVPPVREVVLDSPQSTKKEAKKAPCLAIAVYPITGMAPGSPTTGLVKSPKPRSSILEMIGIGHNSMASGGPAVSSGANGNTTGEGHRPSFSSTPGVDPVANNNRRDSTSRSGINDGEAAGGRLSISTSSGSGGEGGHRQSLSSPPDANTPANHNRQSISAGANAGDSLDSPPTSTLSPNTQRQRSVSFASTAERPSLSSPEGSFRETLLRHAATFGEITTLQRYSTFEADEERDKRSSRSSDTTAEDKGGVFYFDQE